MFRNDRQASAVIAALWWRSHALRGRWTAEEGPTPLAITYLESPRQRPGWSSGELVLWALGWTLWNVHENRTQLGDVLLLGPDWLATVGQLLVAIAGGPTLVDAWVEGELLDRQAAAPPAPAPRLEVVR